MSQYDYGKSYVKCLECQTYCWVQNIHYCYDRANMELTKRRYDHTLGCWVVDFNKEAKEEKKYEFSSCEMPARETPKPEPAKNTYTPCYPWEGLDRKRWTNTWNTLFMMYFQQNWHWYGKYIPDSDYRMRLKGVYPVEPKDYHYSNRVHYGEEWEY